LERLKERLAIARRALATLFDALSQIKTDMNRDASIQRFEYSFETTWKAAQAYLRVVENLQLASPTAVARQCFQSSLMSEEQSRTALKMVADRNLTVHTYDEELAEQIYSRLPMYARLMKEWLDAIEHKAAGAPS